MAERLAAGSAKEAASGVDRPRGVWRGQQVTAPPPQKESIPASTWKARRGAGEAYTPSVQGGQHPVHTSEAQGQKPTPFSKQFLNDSLADKQKT